MARRNKLWRFAQLQTFPNYYEAAADGPEAGHLVVGSDGAPVDLRGRWARHHFGNANPITLELACGRGEYTVALARAYPDRNFVGVDIKGARIYQGAKQCLDEELTNAVFLRTRIEYIDSLFAVGEVDEVWITFPDPFPASVNRRLTSPRFWTNYARLIAPDGRVHLKTDDEGLYAYSRTQPRGEGEGDADVSEGTGVATGERTAGDYFGRVADVDDIYAAPALPHPALAYKTYYEAKHLARGLSIKWLSWIRSSAPAPAPYRFARRKPGSAPAPPAAPPPEPDR